MIDAARAARPPRPRRCRAAGVPADGGRVRFKGMSYTLYLRDPGRLASLLDFLSEDVELLSGLDPDRGLMSLARGAGLRHRRKRNQTLSKKAARQIIDQGCATAVVMGHTHEPVLAAADLNYVNIGSWTRYLDETRTGAKQPSWALLERSAYANSPTSSAMPR